MGSFQQMTSQGRSCSGVSSPAGRSTSTGAVDVAAALISCILSGLRGPGERDLDSEQGSCYKVAPSHEGGARVSIPVRPGVAAGGERPRLPGDLLPVRRATGSRRADRVRTAHRPAGGHVLHRAGGIGGRSIWSTAAATADGSTVFVTT